jgi:hypothetical protein
LTLPAEATRSNVYIAQTARGANTGLDCANASAATFVNTSSNWGNGGAQIGSDTTVHLCGAFTGGNATTFITFYGSGTPGHPVTLLFEPGASLRPNYCAGAGCIDLNGQSNIVIDGGVTCGETGKWTTTACNGKIENQLAGTAGQACPGGACIPLGPTTQSAAIGTSAGSPSIVEIRNLYISLYVRAPSGDDGVEDGMYTYGISLHNGTLAQGIVAHHMIFKGMAKGYLISLGSMTGTLSDYEVYNSNFTDQCWAMGVGADALNMNITKLLFHDNEVSNWDSWARANNPPTGTNDCHPNGTMWFNGNGSTVRSGSFGFIGDATSGIYNNYLHGDLTGAYASSSASGMLSCQDNCITVPVFNNVLIDTCTNTNPVRACGGPIYFNGAGGGGQQIYNNTIVGSLGSNCFLVTSQTAPPLIKNNICTGQRNHIAVRQSGTTWTGFYTGDFNDIYNLGNPNNWVCNNTARCANRGAAAPNDASSITTDPNLDTNYRPQSGGSAVIGLGVNLTSLGIAALNKDILGAVRPVIGAWDAGAYQFTVVSPPAPPTGLTTTVR